MRIYFFLFENGRITSVNYYSKCLGILFLCLLFACSSPPQAYTPISSNSTTKNNVKEKNIIVTPKGDTIPTGVPIPFKGRLINRDSVAPPEVVPIRKPPKTFQAYSNEIPIDNSQDQFWPMKQVEHYTPGEDGVPEPKSKFVKGTIIPIKFSEPITAPSLSMTDNARYDIQYLDATQGLNTSQLREMVIDKRGHLWFSSMFGSLCRYDGTKIVHLSENLGGGGQTRIYQDSKGDMWFGNHNGLYRFDGQQLIHFSNIEETPRFYSGTYIASILEDRNGDFWLGTDNGSLLYLQLEEDRRSGTFTIFTPSEGFKLQGAAELLEDHKGNIWMTYHDNRIGRYTPDATKKKGRFTLFNEKTGLPPKLGFFTLFEDSQHQIWFCGYSHGLLKYIPKEESKTREEGFQSYLLQEDFANISILDIIEDKHQQFWMGTNAGIYHFDPAIIDKGGVMKRINTSDGLRDNSVMKLVRDSVGYLWILTKRGINRYNPNGFQQFGMEAGLKDISISSIAEDSQGQLWFGTGSYMMEGKGFFKYSSQDGGFFTQYTMEQGLPRNAVYKLVVDHNDRIWYNGFPTGYFTGKEFVNFHAEQGLLYNYGQGLMVDKEGDVWIDVSWGPFLFKADSVGFGGTFTAFLDEKSYGMPEIPSIFQDSKDNIWLSTERRGACRLSLNPDRITGNLTYVTVKEGLSHNWNNSVKEDHNGRIWLGSFGEGLSVFDPSKEAISLAIQSLSLKEGLTNDKVVDMVEDAQNRIWVMTEKGLCLFSPISEENANVPSSALDGYQLFTFGKGDGVKFPQFIIDGSLVDSKNKLWLGTSKGVLTLDLNQFELPTHPPQQVQLSHIEVQQQFIDYRNLQDSSYSNNLDFGNVLASAFDSISTFYNYPLSLDLPHHINHLTFHFSAIDWAAPHKIQYSYYLEGLEDKWSPPSKSSEADYRNLPNGDFTLKVKAIGAAQIWSDVFEYSFTIRPPWWRTWGAYILYTLLTIALLYQIYRFNLNRQLEKAEAYRLRELDSVKTKLYTNITHEFRTPLTIIRGMSEQLKKQGNYKIREGLQMIKRNADSLLQLVNQLLDLQKMESGTMRVHLVQGDILPYLKYLVSSFQLYAASKDIRLHFRSDLETFSMDYDPEKIKHIISNLLSNAIKFTPAGGDVYIAIDLPPSNTAATSNFFILKIIDTGQGIAENRLPFIFDRFYQVEDDSTRSAEGTGIGLALVQQLVGLLEGIITVESKLGKGTTFTLQLPVTQLAPVKQEGLELLKMDTDHFVEPLATANVVTPNPAATNAPELPLLLIVEDNLDMQQYLQSCLKGKYRLEISNNGQLGIDKALEIIPDLIISDVMMPDTDGYMLCDRLKKEDLTSHIPIILLTAKGDQASKIEGLQKGADAYITKPFEEKELLVRLEKLIELRQQLQARYAKDTLQIEPATKKEDEFVLKVRQIILDQLDEDSFGIVQLCARMTISRAHLHRKLKALTGKTTSHFIRQIRLQEAQKLLTTTTLNISEVAYAVGFKDPSYFTSVFKEYFGVSPSEMRDSQN